jgi:hypothetical protein
MARRNQTCGGAVSTHEVDDRELAETARAWLAYQEAKDPQYEWAVDRKEEWFHPGEHSLGACDVMRRFVSQACRDVASADVNAIGMIGASLLEDFIHAYPDQALSWVDDEAEENLTLREALTEVWSQGRSDVRGRIDEILARYGKAGASK